jgi:hypothetical protein
VRHPGERSGLATPWQRGRGWLPYSMASRRSSSRLVCRAWLSGRRKSISRAAPVGWRAMPAARATHHGLLNRRSQ